MNAEEFLKSQTIIDPKVDITKKRFTYYDVVKFAELYHDYKTHEKLYSSEREFNEQMKLVGQKYIESAFNKLEQNLLNNDRARPT